MYVWVYLKRILPVLLILLIFIFICILCVLMGGNVILIYNNAHLTAILVTEPYCLSVFYKWSVKVFIVMKIYLTALLTCICLSLCSLIIQCIFNAYI